jgi:hypothetical protein
MILQNVKIKNTTNVTPTKTTNSNFHKCTENLSNTQFTPNGMAILNKGRKYNLYSKPKTWIKAPALEEDNAITYNNSIWEEKQPLLYMFRAVFWVILPCKMIVDTINMFYI